METEAELPSEWPVVNYVWFWLLIIVASVCWLWLLFSSVGREITIKNCYHRRRDCFVEPVSTVEEFCLLRRTHYLLLIERRG